MAEKKTDKLIYVNLEEGYRPHFATAFENHYGPESVFVRGVADCLTWRHVRLLVNSNRIAPNTAAVQLGPNGAREAIEALASVLSEHGVEKPIVQLLQAATGKITPDAIEAQVDAVLGNGTFKLWLSAIERRQYDSALNELGAH